MHKFKKAQPGEEKAIPVIAHYKQAEVEGKLYKLGDCVHVFVSYFPLLSSFYFCPTIFTHSPDCIA